MNEDQPNSNPAFSLPDTPASKVEGGATSTSPPPLAPPPQAPPAQAIPQNENPAPDAISTNDIPAEAPLVGPHAAGLIMDTMPQVAGDIDRIEKEWVAKVKNAVIATRQDPHAQLQLINKLKADYVKKRYSHELKLEEDL